MNNQRPSVRLVEHETPTAYACETFERFAFFCRQVEPSTLAGTCSAKDAATFRCCISEIDRWYGRFRNNLPANLPQ